MHLISTIRDIALARLWSHILHSLVWHYNAEGLVDSLRILLSAGRILTYWEQFEQLMNLAGFAQYLAASPRADALFHVSHRHFLSKNLTFAQRIQCALSHFAYEGKQYDKDYHAAIYGGTGIELWTDEADAVTYRMLLRSTPDTRHEGPVSLVLLADGRWLHELSFAWVDAELFGTLGYEGMVGFVTRNQSVRFGSPDLVAFRAAFPQHSPSYLCLAGMHGIVQLHGQTRIAGIKDRCQIAYEPRYAKSFQNSYSNFWQSFGGFELNAHAYMMPVPPHLSPVSDIVTKHRGRARGRRQLWAQITEDTIDAVKPFYRHAAVQGIKEPSIDSSALSA